MNKILIVSNRLPLQLEITDNQIQVSPSVGGLATGLKSVHEGGNGLWIGWSGMAQEDVPPSMESKVDDALAKANCAGVTLDAKEVDEFYLGFCNKALWPLFHYFMEFTQYEQDEWESYKRVNQKFADVILEHAGDEDTVWVHDYQLLLLPKLLREKKPNLSIGFFLHIPFPSSEIFRTFPWREELLQGMLGADLIGFHTYDYVRHFLNSVKRISDLEVKFNEIHYQSRNIRVDSFPMGIDYDRFRDAALLHQSYRSEQKTEVLRRLEAHQGTGEGKLILSIDRMDYTKGIPMRIRAFEYFLEKYPQFKEKVRLVMLAVPSRSNVPQYQLLKKETDELVGRINGKFSTVSWTPIWYFYRSMPFAELVDLYASAHIALISPLRDGMNLVAKEFVATRVNGDGVLVLSEMAGAASEMQGALLINPSNFEHLADTLKTAIEMPPQEQRERMETMQKRLSRYTVTKWADEFLQALETTRENGMRTVSRRLTGTIESQLLDSYRVARKRLLLLDYDGTLTGFRNNPLDASPDESLYGLLDRIHSEDTEVVIISGRGRETLEQWFGAREYSLITDHGVWLRRSGQSWDELERLRSGWKESIRPILETFVDRTPGSFIEEKEHSLAWHYRKSNAELADLRTMELREVLNSLIANNSLSVLNGNKVIEIKSSVVNKGRAATRLVTEKDYDFIFAIGDDWTDEYMFEELGDSAYTVKVGTAKTAARYYVEDTADVRRLLEKFAQ